MFLDREEAAIRLLRKLAAYRGCRDAVVLAVPRGGLPIGGVLARGLSLTLDVILTKKIGHPANPEFAIGAVGLTDQTVDEELARREGISARWLSEEIARIRAGLRERYRLYRGEQLPPSFAGMTVILTDDGAATGRTLTVAIDFLRREDAARIVVALPVAPPETVELLRSRADEVICLETPSNFLAISQSYEDFSPVADEAAVSILRGAARAGPTLGERT